MSERSIESVSTVYAKLIGSSPKCGAYSEMDMHTENKNLDILEKKTKRSALVTLGSSK